MSMNTENSDPTSNSIHAEESALLSAPLSTQNQTLKPKPRGYAAWRTSLRPTGIIALIALLLLAWQWIETRATLRSLHTELAGRLADSDSAAKEARGVAKQSQESVALLQGKLGELEAQLAASQSHQAALEAMYQELTRNRDERLMSEIEQGLNAAAQQLQLAGNVEAALLALQGIDARLASAGRAQFLSLRKVIARDIERLKALPLADVPGIALRLEAVIASIDAMPLAFEAKPRAEATKDAKASPATSQSMSSSGYWLNAWTELWAEIKGLVRIERLDSADPVLVSPTQSFFLRENLKLRLVNARLALLQRDGSSFREDVQQAQVWLSRYFDKRAKSVQSALAMLEQLGSAGVGVELPTLSESLTTLRNLKVAKERDYPSSSTSAPVSGSAVSAATLRGAR